MAGSRSPRSFRPPQAWLVVLTAGLVFLIALGSERSFARIPPPAASSMSAPRSAIFSSCWWPCSSWSSASWSMSYSRTSTNDPRTTPALRRRQALFGSGSWRVLLPFVLIAVLIALMARRENDSQTTPISLLPPGTLLPIGGVPGSGTSLVVHWWVLGGVAMLGAAVLLCVVLVRRRRRREEVGPRRSEREELLVAVDVSLKELEDDPDPRRAVINAYASMERVLSERGLPRRPFETPLEYLARWAGVLHVGRVAAEALAALYGARPVQRPPHRRGDEAGSQGSARRSSPRSRGATCMRLWRLILLGLAGAVALVIGLVLAGVGNGLALLAYVLFVAALLFAWLIGRSRPCYPWLRTSNVCCADQTVPRRGWSSSRR